MVLYWWWHISGIKFEISTLGAVNNQAASMPGFDCCQTTVAGFGKVYGVLLVVGIRSAALIGVVVAVTLVVLGYFNNLKMEQDLE